MADAPPVPHAPPAPVPPPVIPPVQLPIPPAQLSHPVHMPQLN